MEGNQSKEKLVDGFIGTEEDEINEFNKFI